MEIQLTNEPGIDLVFGPMCCGKTTRAQYLGNMAADAAGLCVLYVNSDKDIRSTTPVSTHNKALVIDNDNVNFVKTKVSLLEDITDQVMEPFDIIIIDEAQFFADLYDRVKYFAEVLEKRVLVFGLSGDYNRKPIGEILSLIPICDTVTKLNSLCKLCGIKHIMSAAHFSHKTRDSMTDIGGTDMYIPLCRSCYLEQTK